MTRLLTALALSLALSNVASAAGAQQERMKACNKEAKEKQLKGDERKAFMKTCLSAEGAAAEAKKPATAQQNRMKDCNKEAGEKQLKGDERKAFMKTCLSSKKAE